MDKSKKAAEQSKKISEGQKGKHKARRKNIDIPEQLNAKDTLAKVRYKDEHFKTNEFYDSVPDRVVELYLDDLGIQSICSNINKHVLSPDEYELLPIEVYRILADKKPQQRIIRRKLELQIKQLSKIFNMLIKGMSIRDISESIGELYNSVYYSVSGLTAINRNRRKRVDQGIVAHVTHHENAETARIADAGFPYQTFTINSTDYCVIKKSELIGLVTEFKELCGQVEFLKKKTKTKLIPPRYQRKYSSPSNDNLIVGVTVGGDVDIDEVIKDEPVKDNSYKPDIAQIEGADLYDGLQEGFEDLIEQEEENEKEQDEEQDEEQEEEEEEEEEVSIPAPTKNKEQEEEFDDTKNNESESEEQLNDAPSAPNGTTKSFFDRILK